MRRPEDSVGDVADTASPEADPAEVVTDVTRTIAAIDMIRTLPADQAEVVLLRVIADLDVPTVATVLGKSEGAVRVHCHRGLRRLAERLAANSPNNSGSAVTEAPPAAII